MLAAASEQFHWNREAMKSKVLPLTIPSLGISGPKALDTWHRPTSPTPVKASYKLSQRLRRHVPSV